MEERIREFLNQREEEGLLRSLTEMSLLGGGMIRVGDKEFINFSSNDYLGLSSHPELVMAAKEGMAHVFGSSASRLMTGSDRAHHLLEQSIAEFKRKPAAIVFNSGYQANVGVLSSICGRDDVVFSDRLNHASIVDGIRLSGAKIFRFLHNDAENLEELLQRERKNHKEALIVTESIFSMDGDMAPLEELVRLKEKYDCTLMVDEAHATGVFGKNGSGLAEETNTTDGVDILMGTFSKAFGGFGAYVASSREVCAYLVNTARSFIYSTSLPPAVAAADLAALDVARKEPYRREGLLFNAKYLREKLTEKGFNIKGKSQIIPLIVGDNEEAVRMSERLKEKGYWVVPVRPPTVPQGQARLRISLTFDHEIDVIDRLIEEIDEQGTYIR